MVATPRQDPRIAFDGDAVTLHSAEATLPDPPNNSGSVAHWNGSHGALTEYEIVITCAGGETLSGAKLLGSTDGFTTYEVMGDLNNAEDINLTSAKGFRARIKHSPEITHYAITGSLAPGSSGVTVTARPLTTSD